MPPPRPATTGLLLLALLSACAGAGGDEDLTGPGSVPPPPGPGPTSLNPNVPPVTAGAWYRPAAGVTWQWQLDGAINTAYDVEVYDVDLFETPDQVLSNLHTAGRKVVCYFSAGSGESGRPDYGQIPPAALGKPLDGYPNERWLDIRSTRVFAVMEARLELAKARGCDGVEPDNVDGYTNDTGFPLTATDMLAFNRNLANAAHFRGLAVALKNDGDQAAELVAYYDFELNEECHAFAECGQLSPFLTAAKPILNVEYAAGLTAANVLAVSVCPAANALGLRTLILPENLDDGFRVSCF